MSSRARGAGGSDQLVELAKLLEKAFNDGGAASRAANDALNHSLAEQGKALAAAHKRNADLEGAIKQLVETLTSLGVAHTQRAIVDAQERLEEKRITADREWKTEAVKQLGPGAKVLLEGIAAKFGPKLLQGDGTPDGDGRAALMRVVMKIVGDTALQDRIVAVVGTDDWVAAMDFLQRQAGGGSAQKTPANGAASN